MVARFSKNGRLVKNVRICRGSAASAALRYAATLIVTVGATLWGGAAVWDAVIDAPASGSSNAVDGTPKTASAVLESVDDWMQNLRSEKFWASSRSGASAASSSARAAKPDFSQRSGLLKASVPTAAPAKSELSKVSEPKGERTDAADWYQGDGGNHRTVCVRLCDGFFWPISFSTDSNNFDRDKRVCEKSCGSPTRLFIHDNPGQDVEQMADLKGNPYTKLRTAFLFRTGYDESCKCDSHPWEQASKDRHRIYALEAEKRKGSQQAAAELRRMTSTLIEARKAATAVRMAAVETGSLAARALPAAGLRRVEAPVPVVMAGHSPLSATLTGAPGLVPTGPASVQEVTPVKPDRLRQWAQMTPQGSPTAGPQTATQSVAPKTAVEPVVKLPAVPFALPSSPPAVGSGPTGAMASLIKRTPVKPASAPVAPPNETASLTKPGKLPVSAPPIVSGANDELGIKAPQAVNTAQLEQVNAPGKPARDQPTADKSETKPERRAEPKVASAEPALQPKPRPAEPRVVERPQPELRRAVVARPAPRPVRVVEAPRPAPQVARVRPQQVTAVRSNDNWRVRVFESR